MPNIMANDGTVDIPDAQSRYAPTDYFMLDLHLPEVQFDLLRSAKVDEETARVAKVFERNLIAASVTAASSWVFAKRAAHRAGYLMMVGITMGTQFPKDFVKAVESTDAELKDPKWNEGLRKMADRIARTSMSEFLEDEPSRDAALTILRQCALLAWSAFEVLASDVFRILANRNPRFGALLLKNDRTRKLYQTKDLISALEDYNYDLSRTMGDVLLGQCRLDNLEAIRTIYDVLFPEDATLREALADVQLWRLYKTRNLIVHRAGIVDEVFRNSTGVDIPVGELLKVTPQQLENALTIVAVTGAQLVKAVESTVSIPTVQAAC